MIEMPVQARHMRTFFERCLSRVLGGGRLSFVATVIAAAVLLVGVPETAIAGNVGDREAGLKKGTGADDQVHIGTFRVGPPTRGGAPTLKPVTPPRGPMGPANSPVQNTPREPARETAAVLLGRALEKLEAKQSKPARRLLEILVARYPVSVEADTARRHLAQLYARVQPAGGGGVGKPRIAPRVAPEVAPLAPSRPVATHDKDGGSDSDSNVEPLVPVNETLSRELGLAVGDRVFFPADSEKLGAKARAVLQRQAQWLKKRANVAVLVLGHADETGGENRNLVLSKRRAIAVRDRLVEEGVALKRISIDARGRLEPIATCRSAVCAAQNRRAVTRILQQPRMRVREKPRG